jgi:hypothetical protein
MSREGKYVGTVFHHGAELVLLRKEHPPVSTRDAQYWDDDGMSVLVTGEDALPGLSPEARDRYRQEMRKKRAHRVNEMGHLIHDEESDDMSNDTLQPTNVESPIKTLADLNKAMRAQYQPRGIERGPLRKVRDHDLALHPIRTLADINIINNGGWHE